MTWLDVLVAVPVSGVVGWASAVSSAGPTARRQHRERLHLNAEREITGLARSYVNELKHGRPNRPGPGRGTFPAGYASIRGQAEFAEQILEQARDLKPRASRSTLRTLRALVGEKTIGDANVGIELAGPFAAVGDGPVINVDPYNDTERLILLDYHDSVGCKRDNHLQCQRDHYPAVRAEYGELGLLWLTTQNDHYQHYAEQYAVAVACLEQLRPSRIWRPKMSVSDFDLR